MASSEERREKGELWSLEFEKKLIEIELAAIDWERKSLGEKMEIKQKEGKLESPDAEKKLKETLELIENQLASLGMITPVIGKKAKQEPKELKKKLKKILKVKKLKAIKLRLVSLRMKMKIVQEEVELESPGLEKKLKEMKLEALESRRVEMKTKREELGKLESKELEERLKKIEEKLKSLNKERDLRQMESTPTMSPREKEELKEELKEMQLKIIEYELESVGIKMAIKRKEVELEPAGSEKRLKEMKLEAMEYELKSLKMEVKMKREEKLASPLSKTELKEMELEAIEHKLESVRMKMKIKKEEGEPETPGLEIESKRKKLEEIEYEVESLRMVMAMKQEEGKLEPSGLEKKLEEKNFEVMLYNVDYLMMEVSMEQKPQYPPLPKECKVKMLKSFKLTLESLMKEKREKIKSMTPVPGMIVLGGRDLGGQSLTSVEGFIFHEGRWIELPPMNIPRSFAASALVGNKIYVSGGVSNGDTGNTPINTIETLNLDATPLQWIISDATLPVPLFGHQTVVYQENLITIGGHDGNDGRTSDRIFEIPLTPPHNHRALPRLPQPKMLHGAELVNDNIFIFGGGRNPLAPSNEVVVFDLANNECQVIDHLPYRVLGMATVRVGNRIFLLGGVGERGDELPELDNVITYDIRSGMVEFLPPMMENRGGCCAVLCPTVENNALVALGSLRELNTVERLNFDGYVWGEMPRTRVARESSTAVVSPVDLAQFEQQ